MFDYIYTVFHILEVLGFGSTVYILSLKVLVQYIVEFGNLRYLYINVYTDVSNLHVKL